MSLINDALKRAGQVRNNDVRARSARTPHGLEPAGLQPKPTPWLTLFLTGAIVLSLLTTSFLIVAWMKWSAKPAGATPADLPLARAHPPAADPPTPRSIPGGPSAALPVSPAELATAGVAPVNAQATKPLLAGAEANPEPKPRPGDSVRAESPAPPGDSAGAIDEEREAAVAALKLQAIIYHPDHPMVMINSRTLGVGERFDDHTEIISIDRSGVTLKIRGKVERLKLY